jgi:acyl carrier protein
MIQNTAEHTMTTLLALAGEITRETITEDLDLLAAGLDSIGAMELAARLEEELGVLCTIEDVFDAPSLVDLARALTERIDVAGGR